MLKQRLDEADEGSKQRFLFIRDENFALQKDYEKRLELITRAGARTYLFASANTLTDKVVDVLADNSVYMVCLGLEDPTKEYKKNKGLGDAISRLKDRDIFTYLSFIVDPLEVVDPYKGDAFYSLLYEKFAELEPEMVCGNFLMPFPGTPLWEQYHHLVSEKDFKDYDSKTPFLVKDELVAARLKRDMFGIQWEYYTSPLYNKDVRTFAVGDTLHLRFLELKEEFDHLNKTFGLDETYEVFRCA
jgi:hypothetical protein